MNFRKKHSKFYYRREHGFIVRGGTKDILHNRAVRLILQFIFSTLASFAVNIRFLLNRSKYRNYKYNIGICAIFKDEAPFLKEWIDFHLGIGVEHFILYNNNSSDNYKEILEPYINNGKVSLIDWVLSDGTQQKKAYQDCLNKFSFMFRWIGFLDIDEFVCPVYESNILNWLQKFDKYPSVAIYWKQFGSSGVMIHDYKTPVIEQYTQSWDLPSVFSKAFVQTKYKFSFEDPHVFYTKFNGLKIPSINQYGHFIYFGCHRRKKCNDIQINHYWGKAQDLFSLKIKKGAVWAKSQEEYSQTLLKIFKSHEECCIVKDYTIQRFLHLVKRNWDFR